MTTPYILDPKDGENEAEPYTPWKTMGLSMYWRMSRDCNRAIAARDSLSSVDKDGITSVSEKLIDKLKGDGPPVVVVNFDESNSKDLEPGTGFSEFEFVTVAIKRGHWGRLIIHLPKQRAKDVALKEPTGYDDPDQEPGLLLLRSVIGQLLLYERDYRKARRHDQDDCLISEEYKDHDSIVRSLDRLREMLPRLAKELPKGHTLPIIVDTASLEPDERLNKALRAVLSLPQELAKEAGRWATFKVLANLPAYAKDDDIFSGIEHEYADATALRAAAV